MHSLVTVFGGSGFLGRYSVRALAQAGYRIRVGVRSPNLANFLLPMGHVGQIQLTRANVTDADSVAAAVKGASAVVNFVGILQESGRRHFAAIHTEAAGTIARAAKSAGAEALVHVSALGADAAAPALYARTKAEGERRLLEEFPAVAILRPSLVFGPEDNFFNRFAGLARLLPALPLIGGGMTKFQPVYVTDVARAVLTCVQQSPTRGNIYELGGPRIYSFRELIELTLREIGRRRWLVPLPFPLAMLQAAILQILPRAPLTRDQVRLLKRDSVVQAAALTFASLGIEPEPLEAILPLYLWRFRRAGQYERGIRIRLSESAAASDTPPAPGRTRELPG